MIIFVLSMISQSQSIYLHKTSPSARSVRMKVIVTLHQQPAERQRDRETERQRDRETERQRDNDEEEELIGSWLRREEVIASPEQLQHCNRYYKHLAHT